MILNFLKNNHPDLWKSKLLKWCNIALFFSLVFLIFYFQVNAYNIFFDIFTERDIQRALGWLKGKFYWPGPEMSYGSNLPGPFFYFLLFPPLIFADNIYSQSLIWHIVWLSLTYTTAFHFTSRICRHKESLLISVMFFISCMRDPYYNLFSPINYAWNPSFAVMFHVLSVIALYYWKETKKNSYLYSLGLIIGFGIQIHFLVSLHMLTAFILYLFEKNKGLKPIVLFIALALLPCLPYCLMYSFNVFEISSYSTEYLITTFKLWTFSDKWVGEISKITSFKIYLIGPFFFVFFLTVWKTIKKTFPFTKSTINLLMVMALPMLVSVLWGVFIWYMYFIPVFLILFFSKLCDDLMPKNQNKQLNYLLIYGVLFIFPLLLENITYQTSYHILRLTQDNFMPLLLLVPIVILSSIKRLSYNSLWKSFIILIILNTLLKKPLPSPTINTDLHSPIYQTFFKVQYYPYGILEPLFKQIVLETNWDAKTAMKRIFLISNVDVEISLLSYYALTKEKSRKKKKDNLSEFTPKADGYFIVQHLQKFTAHTLKEWKQYLSHSPFVPNLIQKEIRAGRLIIKTPKLYREFSLIPYEVTEKSVFLEGFHNIDQPYYWEEPDWLKNCVYTHHFIDNNEFYYCMTLPGQLQRAGVHINFSEENTRLFTEIGFFGPLLGLKAEVSNMDGYAFWSNVEMSLFCNSKKYSYFVPNVGFNSKSYPPDVISRSISLNTPLKLKIPVHCEKEKISQIKLSFEHFRKKSINYSETISEKKEIIWKNF